MADRLNELVGTDNKTSRLIIKRELNSLKIFMLEKIKKQLIAKYLEQIKKFESITPVEIDEVIESIKNSEDI